ncbi:MAG: hypothetical protein ACXACF_05140 [Candidatus Hermodarchaeia archaeon]|jgi:hypothetical protein
MENTSVFVPNEMASIAIQQMQLFSWTLVGQESTIHREEPCHELSFVRALDVPYLDRIRELEDQYPFGELPNVPVSNHLGGSVRTLLACVGFIFLAFSFVGALMHLGDPVFSLGLQYPDWFSFKAMFWGVINGIVLLAIWRRWTYLDVEKRATYLRANEEVVAKRGAIEMELRELFQSSINPP